MMSASFSSVDMDDGETLSGRKLGGMFAAMAGPPKKKVCASVCVCARARACVRVRVTVYVGLRVHVGSGGRQRAGTIVCGYGGAA